MSDALGTAAGLGAVTGLRSFTGLAMVSRELAGRRRLPRSASRLEAWLAEDLVALTLTGLAIGELVVDKMPGIPDRVSPSPLFARSLIGGILGAVVAGPDERLLGAVVGAAAAITAAYGGWFMRREIGRATLIPDAAIALGEDAMALAGARELVGEL